MKCAVEVLAGAFFMAGAVTLLRHAGTPERRVLGVLGVVGSLAWILLWGQFLRVFRGMDGQPDPIDTP
jgi:hypothetical protein